MNKVILMGNLTSKPEPRYTISNKLYVRFTLAVKRDKDNTDFINCVSWGKQGEFIANYFDKGQAMLICGRIQTSSYDDKDGNKRYTTDIIVEEVKFVGKKETKNETKSEMKATPKDDPFADFGDEIEIDNYLE